MESDIWIKRRAKPRLKAPAAVVGSPGLRSIGKLAVDALIERTGAKLMAEFYSTHLPTITRLRLHMRLTRRFLA
jgi:proteasome assembly chaperone (PAC2) family protein